MMPLHRIMLWMLLFCAHKRPGCCCALRVMDMNWRASAAAAAFLVVCSVPSGMASAAGLGHSGMQLAGLFGESDEEKAARQQHENDQDTAIADLRQRLHDLEQSLQTVTGQNETLTHRIRELSDHIDQQQKNFDNKLCTLVAQQLGADTAAGQGGMGLPCDAPTALAAQGGTLQASGAPGAPQVIGAVAGVRSQYDEAMSLLAKARYEQARAAFRAFADGNPKDSLTPQAVYWVGNIAFVQKDYPAAALAFAEQLKKFPASPQSPESMLKLGQSLIALGQKKEGCLTLGAIKSKYKQAPATILTQAATVHTASCK
jgi:tol-pal system protein YbgF